MDEQFKTLAQSARFTVGNGRVIDPQLALSENEVAPRVIAVDTIIDGKYRIIELLGEGGMGVVYRAHHLMLGKDVALKTFRSVEVSEAVRERFLREVKAVAILKSKYVVQVFDSGFTADYQPYYTMELLVGESLADRLSRSKRLSQDKALSVFRDVASGLLNAHSKGIVHRDLKPANIFLVLDHDQIVGTKIVDFGIAKLVGSSGEEAQRLTACGTVFGSPLYMSPEQSIGDLTDQRTDIYSFGCSLFEALVGRPPYFGKTALETLLSHQQSPVPTLHGVSGRTFPDWLEDLIALTLAKDPEMRLQTFEEVIEMLDRRDMVETEDLADQAERREGAKKIAYACLGFLVLLCMVLFAATFSHGHQSVDHSAQTIPAAPSKPGKAELNQSGPAGAPEGITAKGTAVTAAAAAVIAPNVTEAKATAAKMRAGEAAATSSTTTTAPGRNATDLFQELDKMTTMHEVSASDIKTCIKDGRFRQHHCVVTAHGFDLLAHAGIEELDISQSTIDNTAVYKLALAPLTSFNAPYSNFNDNGARGLLGCTHLKRVKINATRITNRGIAEFLKMPSLHWIDLSNTVADDSSLLMLAKMPRLDLLQLTDTNVTASGVRKLCRGSKILARVEINKCKNISPTDLLHLENEFPKIHFKSERESGTI